MTDTTDPVEAVARVRLEQYKAVAPWEDQPASVRQRLLEEAQTAIATTHLEALEKAGPTEAMVDATLDAIRSNVLCRAMLRAANPSTS